MTNWESFFSQEYKKEYFQDLLNRVSKQREEDIVYPSENRVFYAFEKTPFDKVKVVIIGQDPYHGKDQAMGLAFSVSEKIKKLPPSLKNIYKEVYKNDLDKIPKHGDLTSWAEQGVFLLNASLTVSESKPNSHSLYGWKIFTDNCIRYISENKSGVVFLLWGNFAKGKEEIIDTDKHHIISTTHPSPFSARKGFLGSDCFSKANDILISNDQEPIFWKALNIK